MQLQDKYKIIQQLGSQKRRKFADVFLVEEIDTKKRFVLKFAALEKHGEVGVEQLKQEAAFTFSFPGLPLLVEKVVSENEALLLFEWKNGTTLDVFTKEMRKKEKITFIKEFTTEIVPIFKFLAKERIVHCDIKESNFLIDRKDGQLVVSLIDFGLAINTHHLPTRKTLFPLGYAAPELLLNQLSLVDQRTDFFSLGIIYWKMMVGNLPLTHANPSIFTNLQLTHPLPKDGKIPKELFEILAKMCAKHQFQTAPNRMERDKVLECLEEGKSKRYSSIDEIEKDILQLPERRSFLINFFSKSNSK
ncbi:MAG: protein kinase [Bacteroidota bacterium]